MESNNEQYYAVSYLFLGLVFLGVVTTLVYVKYFGRYRRIRGPSI